MNNSGIRKLISYFLVIALIMGMALPVSADDPAETTVPGPEWGSSSEIINEECGDTDVTQETFIEEYDDTDVTPEDIFEASDDAAAEDETGAEDASVTGEDPEAANPEENTPEDGTGSGEDACAEESAAEDGTGSGEDEGTEESPESISLPALLESQETVTEDPEASALAKAQAVFQELSGAVSTAQYEVEISEGVYIFRSALDNDYVLDLTGRKIFNNTKLQLRKYDKSDSQMFRFKKNGDGTYTITAFNCEKLLGVEGGSKENGARLQINSAKTSKLNKWRVYKNSDKTFTIKNAATKKAIDISGGVAENGRAVQMWKANNTTAQKFRLRMIGKPKHKYNGEFMIVSAVNTHKVIDIAGGSTLMGANVQLYEANGTKAQWFKLMYVANGYYRIVNMKSRKTLDVAGGKKADGANIQQYKFNKTAAQLWRIAENSDGTVTFHSKLSDKMALELAGGKTKNGTNVQLYTYSKKTKGQKFILDKTGKISSGLQATDLKGLSEKAVVKKIGPLCKADQKKSGVLACITIAQFILESGYGSTDLAQKANNCFGMKTSLSGNTWKGSTWDGVSKYTKKTAEYDSSGKKYYITADFRKYPCVEDSIADHSAYLLGAEKDSGKLRYSGLKGQKDYKKAITIIKKGGYATDPEYVNKICNIIERFDLTKYNL